MSPLETITEEKIRQECGDVVFERAFEYACSGLLRKRMVFAKTWEVRAEISGNYGNYQAVFRPLKNGLIHTWCTCPAEMPFCKHAAALGITWIREPDSFLNLDSIAAIVQQKTKTELEELMLQVLYRHPDTLSLFGIEGFEDEDELDDEDDFYEE